MSKLQEIQTIREALERNLSKIDGLCTHYSTNEGRSIKQIQEMHERLLTKCEDILKGLRALYPNSVVLTDQIKKMAKGAEEVYPYEHVYGDDRVFPIKEWDFWHQHINDGDIFKKRKSFFAFKADLLMLLSEYAKPDNLLTKDGTVATADLAKLNPNVIDINNSPNFIDTPLKGIFKDGNRYNEIIQLLIDNGLIISNQNVLIWKGFRPNRKIDLIAFCEVLFNKSLLTDRVDNYRKMTPILNETFPGFTISKKSFGKSDSVNIHGAFKELLSSF